MLYSKWKVAMEMITYPNDLLWMNLHYRQSSCYRKLINWPSDQLESRVQNPAALWCNKHRANLHIFGVTDEKHKTDDASVGLSAWPLNVIRALFGFLSHGTCFSSEMNLKMIFLPLPPPHTTVTMVTKRDFADMTLSPPRTYTYMHTLNIYTHTNTAR